MAAEYVLFVDRREKDESFEEGMEITHGGYSEASADEVLPRLRRIDWAHPAQLVYREDGENRWSYVMLGLSPKPELGE